MPEQLKQLEQLKAQKDYIISSILKYKIIAIIRNIGNDEILYTAEALYNGGIKLMEVTFDQSGRFSEEYTAKQISLLASHFGDGLLVGSGTVITEQQVVIACDAGAKYIISPNTDEKVIKKTNECGMVSIPGALTPTEIQYAHACGADFVKLFPAENLGIGYIKAILAPLSHIKMLAVGGVDENNLNDFLSAGIKGVGVGSNITKKELIKQGEYSEITKLAKKYTSQI